MSGETLQIRLAQPKGKAQTDEEMKAWMARVEWHYRLQGKEPSEPHACHRHGVIRNIPEHQYPEVVYFLSYHWLCYPKQGMWWTKQVNGLWSVEFVGQSDQVPSKSWKPWEWCGESILFEKWHKDVIIAEERRRRAISALDLHVGDIVEFDYKGTVLRGVVKSVRKNASVLVGRAQFRVPLTLLRLPEK